jgi:formamidopyrimidine-DNA glycosylase
MPELPEVEVTRISFAEKIKKALILEVRTGKPLRWPLGCSPQSLQGLRVQNVSRRGKYLIFHLDSGVLLMHLGMSGSLRFETRERPVLEKLHDHFVLMTDKGTLTLNDPRRFGAVVYAQNLGDRMAQKLLSSLGLEPLEDTFTSDFLFKSLRGKKVSIKQALLGGQIVVGVGNIYASESLFKAGMRPTRQARLVTKAQCALLVQSIKDTLQRAIAVGGSTLQNFSDATGASGYFQQESFVYARRGEACRICKTLIKQIVQAQRSTFYCPFCQK